MTVKILVFLIFLYCVNGFYLPGIAPVNYCYDEKENCKVSNANVIYF